MLSSRRRSTERRWKTPDSERRRRREEETTDKWDNVKEPIGRYFLFWNGFCWILVRY
jgi:hypothetical protein